MIAQVTIPELQAAMADGARVIDVREQFEYSDGHVAGSVWVPMSLVPLKVEEFRGKTPAYVICRTGNRSGQVVMWLARQGIEAINVDGGIVAWQQAGLPVVTGMESEGSLSR
jgi:rhodanese-related sulfurtransferase